MLHNLFRKKSQPKTDDKSNAEKSAQTVMLAKPKPVVPPVVIFDFDGVLADSLIHLLSGANDFIVQKNIEVKKCATYQDLVALRDNAMMMLSLKDKGRMLFSNKAEAVKAIADKLASHITETAIYSGVKELLGQLRESGALLVIVTTNRATTVMEFLKHHGIDGHFHSVVSSEGVDKTSKLEALIKKEKWSKEHTFYVSGRTDYVSTVTSMAKSVGAVWGLFDNKDSFDKAKAEHIVETPDQLLNLVKQHHQAQAVTVPVSADPEPVVAPVIVPEAVSVPTPATELVSVTLRP